MKKHNLIGKEFKWLSPKTGGITFGVIDKVINENNYPKIVSTKNNAYYLIDCEVKINEEFEKIALEKNVGDYQTN